MAAIYIHIPFCKKACYYCDFHFSTNTSAQAQMNASINKELVLQRNYFADNEAVETIYFGGGTPSLLNQLELESILKTVYQNFNIIDNPEITLEANPDDINPEKLQVLKKVGINRLSIGVQSFYEPHLHNMNRAHTATEAYQCIIQAREAGFENFTIDLIYGIPAADHEIWKEDLRQAMELRPPHISAYCLTIEPDTVFGKLLKKGKLKNIEEEFAAQQYELLVATLRANGYEQYEISNFALKNYYSRHNSNYWKKGSYLGIGASAHSYNGESRQYNVRNNQKYMDAIEKGIVPFEKEELTPENHINEYIMVSLRTMWGCSTHFLQEKYNFIFPTEKLNNYQERGLLTVENGIIKLTESGKLLADDITGNLFI